MSSEYARMALIEAREELAVAKSRINELISLASVSITVDDIPCLMEAWVAAWDECWRKQWAQEAARLYGHGWDGEIFPMPEDQKSRQLAYSVHGSAALYSSRLPYA